MPKGSYLFTSESVTEGHPDKMCDQVSDAIVDAILEKEARLERTGYIDPDTGKHASVKDARIAVETLMTTGTVVVAGEVRTSVYVDIQKIVRETIRRIGYDRAKYGFDCDTCGVLNLIHEQSPDIAQGVDESYDAQAGKTTDPLDQQGAGDQGCIAEGSLVSTLRGLVPIETVHPGDYVLTNNGYRKVLVSKETGVKDTVLIETDCGRQLRLTPDHLVHTANGEWTSAEELLGQKIVTHDASDYNVETVQSIVAAGLCRVFDLEVEQDHEFFANGINVHNCMFGYACDETPALMPMPIYLAHRLAKRLAKVRKDHTVPYLRPDGKTQVTVRYEDDRPAEVTCIVVSTQHAAEIKDMAVVKRDMLEHVIKPVMSEEGIKWGSAEILVNPTGRFEVGGPQGDTGVTGRKVIVDTYGGMGRHGGGAFSGKDASKVDRSATYAARWVAKNVVAAGLADKCEVEISYAIGVARPLSVLIDTHGTAVIDEKAIEDAVQQVFDLRPGAIVRDLDLLRPIYGKTAAYGHFGRADDDFTWERTDKADELRRACGLA